MPAPTYASSGAGVADNGTSGAIAPLAPATVAAGNLLIWHGFVMSDPNGGSLSTPTGFTAFPGNPYGTRTVTAYTPRVYLFWKIAAGTEGGVGQSSNYVLAGAVNSRGVYARIHRFAASNGFLAAPIEAIAVTQGVTATGSTTLPCPTVTPGGTNRLGVVCCTVGDNAGTVGDATGATGGSWIEPVGVFESAIGGDGTIELEVADLSGGGEISGGAVPYGITGDEWVNVGFALVESANIFLTPGEGTAAASGASPTLTSILAAAAGAGTAQGDVPAVASELTPAGGAAAAVGETPTVGVSLDINPTAGTSTATGAAPSISLSGGVNTVEIGAVAWIFQGVLGAIAPDAGVAAASGNAPALSLDLVVQSGAALASGNDPTISVTSALDLTPQEGTVAASGDIPTLQQDLQAVAGEGTATGASPAITGELQAQAGTASAQGAVPVLILQEASTPITGVCTLSGSEPALSLILLGQSGLASAQGAAPTLGVESALTPIAGTATASGNDPTLTLAQLISPQAGEASATGTAPPLSLTLQAQAGLATAAGASPERYIQTANTPLAGLVAASGNAPTLASQILAVAGQAAALGDTPALALTLQASSGAAVAAGNQPVTWLQAENSPLTGLALASGNAPLLSLALAPTRGIALASGTPPHVSTGLDLTPQTSTVQASGNLSLRQLAFGPAPALAAASGSAPTLTQILVPSPDGIILAGGPSPTTALDLAPTAGTAGAVGNEPERFVGRFIFPETGFALASAPEASTQTLILELLGTTTVRAIGNAAEVQLALPGNRRETALTRLFARLLLLTPGGVLVVRNSTIPLAVPPAGAVVMLDSGPDTADRGIYEDFYNHRVRLELFIMKTNALTKTIQDLEDEVAAILAGDRTLGGVIDQMFLFPTSSLALAGGGTPIDINALSVALSYGEPHAQL